MAQTRFIRMNGRIIPIKVKKGSALDETSSKVRKSTNTGAIGGAAAGLALTSTSPKKLARGGSVFKSNFSTIKRISGKKGLATVAGSLFRNSFRKSSLIEIGLGAAIGSLVGSSLLGSFQRRKQSDRLQKKFGDASIKNIKKAGSVGF